MTQARDNSWRQRATNHALGLSLVCVVAAALFGPPLWRGECPGYRDAGHFYYPTLKHTTERWAAGEVPLWNPYDNAGQPLAADATSAVFYPGRILLHLPLRFERNITLYLAAHWLLAIFGVRRLAKRFSDSSELQFFAAIIYGLSGYVAGQMFNVVFLVGAAWLPWAWDAWESLRNRRDLRTATRLATVLAMMVLGGDPQIAYHVALLALLDSISWRRTVREAANSFLEPTFVEGFNAGKRLTWPWFRSRWVILALTCTLAVGLSGIQVIPSLTWSMRSDRAIFEEPRSIWEWLSRAGAKEDKTASLAALVTSPAANTHDENLYDFSFAPMRVAEFVAPGVFGELGPHYQNWLKALTPHDRWWTSTNYVGLFTLAAALIALRTAWSNRQVRAAGFVAMIALLSSFGVWGLGAIWNALARQAGMASELNSAAGGLYWLWVTCLPGYTGFRYPSKWLVFFTLAIVLLAARGMHEMLQGDQAARTRALGLRILPYSFVLLALATSVAWVVLLLAGSDAFRSWGKIPVHPLYGPFDVEGSLRCIRFALARTCCVSLVLAGLLFAWRNSTSTIPSQALMLFTLAELIGVVWLGPVFKSGDYWMRSPPPPAFAENISPNYRLYRASSARLQPLSWAHDFDSQRLAALRQWEQSTLAPRYHWLTQSRVVESRGTTISAEYAALLDFLHRCPPDDLQEPAWIDRFHPYDLLSARYSLLPRTASVRDAQPLAEQSAQESDWALWDRSHVPPRAWIAPEVSLIPEIRGQRRSDLAQQTAQILLDRGRFRDLRQKTLVESDAPDPLFAEICGASSPHDSAHIEWHADDPEHIELEVTLDRPGLLVLADAFDPAWGASRSTNGAAEVKASIFRANRVLRGVCLPAGRHRVHFRYQPWEIPAGAVLSIASWLFAVSLAILIGPAPGGFRLHALFRLRKR